MWPSVGSLHLSPPECQLILPSSPDSQLDTPAPSEWRAALAPRNFPPLSVSQSWLEITGLWWKHSPPSHHQINFQLFYLPSFLFISLLPLIPTLSLPFQCHQLSLATPSLPLIRCSSWQLNDKREMSGRKEWRGGLPPEWSQNDVMGAFVLLVWRLPFLC